MLQKLLLKSSGSSALPQLNTRFQGRSGAENGTFRSGKVLGSHLWGHTRPEMDVKKTRLIHLCSRRSRALSAPALQSLGSWLTLSRCWGGCADTETINRVGKSRQNPHYQYQSDSPFCIPLATKEVFLIRLSPPALSAERRSYIHLHSFHTWQWRCSSIFTCKLPRD